MGQAARRKTTNKKYFDKFKDLRWQKKRLEILERDRWTCQLCGDKTSQLHVHHNWYEEGKDPWDYVGICLVTLCSECHDIEHESRREGLFLLAFSLLSKGYFYSDFDKIALAISSAPIETVEEFFDVRITSKAGKVET